MEQPEHSTPDWAETLVGAIGDTIEFKGIALLEARHAAPDDSVWGVDLVEVAPALMRTPEADGAVDVFGVFNSFDLLAAQRAFDSVSALLFGVEADGRSCLTIEGRSGDREVVVLVYTTPFPDAEVSGPIPGAE